jgi:hypothetical protein
VGTPSEAPPQAGRLPNFLILGAMKSGTTSLYMYLKQHPDVFLPQNKEPMFFLLRDGTWVRDYVVANYGVTRGVRDLADYRRLFAPGEHCRAVGEATAIYLAEPKVARGIKELLGQPKLLAILRHPADRAFSQYRMCRRFGVEPLETFEEAIDAEPWRVSTGWSLGYQYVRLGYYARQLRAYWETLGPASVRLYWYEDLAADSRGVVTDVFRYLGVDPTFRVDVGTRHLAGERRRLMILHRAASTRMGRALRRGAVPGRVLEAVRKVTHEQPRMAAATRNRLIEMYRDDIRELEVCSGRNLAHWFA